MHKCYSKYKDSGIEWIGNIPEHWDVIRDRFVFNIISGNGFPEDLQGRSSGDYPFFKCSDINFTGVLAERANNYVDEEDVQGNKWSIVPRQSLMFAKIGEALKKNHRKINKNNCLVDNNMMAISLKDDRESIKYYYFMMCLISMEWFVNPGAVPSVNVSKFRSFFIPAVNAGEQKQIECFLDRKTTQIDDLIAKKERMVELLKEERTAVINQAVTKGLDPNVEMKDSGIEWLGEVPKHWEVKKLKFNSSIRFSNVDKKSNEGEQDVRLCNYVDVYYNDCITLKLDFMKATASIEEIRKFQLNIGDVIVTKDSESWDDIAVPAYVAETESKLLCGYHLAQIKSNVKVLNGKFLFWMLSGSAFNYQYKIDASGVTRYGLGNYALSNSFIVVPPMDEQEKINVYLDKKTIQIDEQVEREQKSIELLKEYRTALISEVVTGKIDVRSKIC